MTAASASSYFFKAAGLTLFFVLAPSDLNGGSDRCCTSEMCGTSTMLTCAEGERRRAKLFRQEFQEGRQPLIIYTDDVNELPEDYRQLMHQRIREGKAHPSDHIYASRLRDDYETNPAHDPSGNKYNSEKAVQPANVLELWNKRCYRQVNGKGKVIWWAYEGTGSKAVYHQFFETGNNNNPDGKTFHWAGSSNGKTKSGNPSIILDQNIPQGIKNFATRVKPR